MCSFFRDDYRAFYLGSLAYACIVGSFFFSSSSYACVCVFFCFSFDHHIPDSFRHPSRVVKLKKSEQRVRGKEKPWSSLIYKWSFHRRVVAKCRLGHLFSRWEIALLQSISIILELDLNQLSSRCWKGSISTFSLQYFDAYSVQKIKIGYFCFF